MSRALRLSSHALLEAYRLRDIFPGEQPIRRPPPPTTAQRTEPSRVEREADRPRPVSPAVVSPRWVAGVRVPDAVPHIRSAAHPPNRLGIDPSNGGAKTYRFLRPISPPHSTPPRPSLARERADCLRLYLPTDYTCIPSVPTYTAESSDSISAIKRQNPLLGTSTYEYL